MWNAKNSPDTMDQYVSEVTKVDLLSRAEEQALAKKYQETKDPKVLNALVAANLRFVIKIAHQYRGYGFPLLDLVQEGNVGLLLAAKRFDPERGYRFVSYAVWWIKAYIQDFIMRSWSMVKIGTTQAQRKLFFKLRSSRFLEAQQKNNGELPSHKELALKLGVSEKEVSKMELRLAARDFSLDMKASEDSRGTIVDRIPDLRTSPEDIVAHRESDQSTRQILGNLAKDLSERERYIIVNRLMSDEPKTLQQIGRHFRISRERARQIQSNLVSKLRASFVDSGLEPMAA